MKPYVILSVLWFTASSLFAQAPRILHYSETSGFDHGTRSVSYSLFQQIAAETGCTVDHDSTGAAFGLLSDLLQYSIIVFANTSGDALLDSAERSHFEQYVASGGHVMGIHAATDTYRHSTANGTNTGTWDYYAELMGASVQQSPNHVAGTPVYAMYAQTAHPILSGIPDPWVKAEEYYYWENGYFDSTGNQVLLKVETTVAPDLTVHSYDSARATAWYRIIPAGSRVFYTALGHAQDNYTSDTLFHRLLTNAVRWLLNSTAAHEPWKSGWKFFTDEETWILHHPEYRSEISLKLTDMTGRTLFVRKENFDRESRISSDGLPPGVYLLQIQEVQRPEVCIKLIRQ